MEMSSVTERFLRYVSVDTQSKDDQEAFPSTEKQKNLGRMLKAELEAMGLSNVRMDSCIRRNSVQSGGRGSEGRASCSWLYFPHGYGACQSGSRH